MPVQTQTFKNRILSERCTLDPRARLIALAIAERRYAGKGLHSGEGLAIPLSELARACGMSRGTAGKWLAECIAAGWIVRKSVYRDGRQHPTEYYLADPPRPRSPGSASGGSDTELRPGARTQKVPTASGGPDAVLRPGDEALSVSPPDTVLRSKNTGEAGPQPAVASSNRTSEGPAALNPEPRCTRHGERFDPGCAGCARARERFVTGQRQTGAPSVLALVQQERPSPRPAAAKGQHPADRPVIAALDESHACEHGELRGRHACAFCRRTATG